MRVAYSCVVDGKPKYEWQAYLWVYSLLRNVSCNPFDIKVHCLPSISIGFMKALTVLGVDAIQITPFEGEHVYCNKIMQCFSAVYDGYAKIVLADTDIFFLGPINISPKTIFAGKTVDLQNPSMEILKEIYNDAKIRMPDKISVTFPRFESDTTFRTNFNGGFYIIDKRVLEEIGVCWKKNALWLLSNKWELLGKYTNHIDQIAMGLTLDELDIPVSLLPLKYNFPTHIPLENFEAMLDEEDEIVVLHYHNQVDANGFLLKTANAYVDRYINSANATISDIIEKHHNNMLFWNNRYSMFPELGSGIGSRGDILAYKRQILAYLTCDFVSGSVVEVGCGDLETSRDLSFVNYTGYDISSVCIEIARQKRQDWRFVCGPFSGCQIFGSADLIMCLDVLIHQKTAAEYKDLIYAISTASKRRLIVSGYIERPIYTSPIIGYHEPLTESLGELNIFSKIEIAGSYRDQYLVVADR